MGSNSVGPMHHIFTPSGLDSGSRLKRNIPLYISTNTNRWDSNSAARKAYRSTLLTRRQLMAIPTAALIAAILAIGAYARNATMTCIIIKENEVVKIVGENVKRVLAAALKRFCGTIKDNDETMIAPAVKAMAKECGVF